MRYRLKGRAPGGAGATGGAVLDSARTTGVHPSNPRVVGRNPRSPGLSRAGVREQAEARIQPASKRNGCVRMVGGPEEVDGPWKHRSYILVSAPDRPYNRSTTYSTLRLSLSPSELDRLTDLVEALQAPFDYPDVDAWRHAVNHHARLLLGAHKVVFILPGPGHAPVYCQRLDPDGFRAYIDYYHRFDVAGAIAIERSLPVSSLLEIHGREEFYASEYYNDFMRVWNCNH